MAVDGGRLDGIALVAVSECSELEELILTQAVMQSSLAFEAPKAIPAADSRPTAAETARIVPRRLRCEYQGETECERKKRRKGGKAVGGGVLR